MSKFEELQNKCLTRQDVAKLFKVKPYAVYRWERLNPNWIKPVKIGKYVGYRVEDVEAYLDGKMKKEEN